MTDLDDIHAIRELTYRYCRAIDGGDFVGWVNTFSDDGIFESAGERVQGHAALLEFIIGRDPQTLHVTMDSIVNVEGDTATQNCTVVVFMKTDTTAYMRAVGYYDDKLVRTSDGWRFSQRFRRCVRSPLHRPSSHRRRNG